MINKENLKKSINLISDIDFTDEEYEKLYEKFENTLEDNEINQIFERINVDQLCSTSSLTEILKRLKKEIDIDTMEKLKKLLVNNEDLINFIQDLFLDKLI
ncbi:MAG: hypothetical protein ACOC1K_02655 [Nanoarchaeota archaeon]